MRKQSSIMQLVVAAWCTVLSKCKRRKGIMQLATAALAIVVAIVIAQVGSVILDNTNSTMAGSSANVSTITNIGHNSVNTIATWIRIIAIVVSAGLALRYLMGTFVQTAGGGTRF